MALEGLHHITAITADAPRNVDFYARLLGLRLVKKTVNFDQPDVYHLYFGDEARGRPARSSRSSSSRAPRSARGRRDGPHDPVAGRIRRRARVLGDAPGRRRRRRERATAARCASPTSRACATSCSPPTSPTRRSSPSAPDIPAEHALAGLPRRARVRARPERERRRCSTRSASPRGDGGALDARAASSATALRLRRAARRSAAARAPGRSTTSPGRRPTTPSSPRSASAPSAAGARATTIIDRQYFHSVYFREPSGVLFELPAATSASSTTSRSSRSARSSSCRRSTSPSATQLERTLTPLTQPARGRGMIELAHQIRPAAGEPRGALVLLHGRGADEHDLLPFLDLLDPQRRLVGVTPGGPLFLPPGGRHWYVVPRVGYPDPTRSPRVATTCSSGRPRAHRRRPGSARSSAASRRAR